LISVSGATEGTAVVKLHLNWKKWWKNDVIPKQTHSILIQSRNVDLWTKSIEQQSSYMENKIHLTYVYLFFKNF